MWQKCALAVFNISKDDSSKKVEILLASKGKAISWQLA
jgi:hypothetical protein